MSRFIVVANRKGGCGKTTTVVNLSHALALKGKKILVVDLDPQAHSTLSLGVNPLSLSASISDVLINNMSAKEIILDTRIKNISLIPSSRDLSSFEMEFSSIEGSETLLSERIYKNIPYFDYIIFDPPPTIGLMTVSVLIAAKEAIIPVQMHYLAMEGLAEMMQFIYKINATYNSDLEMSGIIPTFYNKHTKLAKQIIAEINKNFGKEKLLPGIRSNITLAEAPGFGKTIFEYSPSSNGAKDYKKLADNIDNQKRNTNG